MASIASSTVEHGTANNVALDPRKYKALNELLGTSDFNKPDVRDLLVKTYGDQGITGFLQLTGAVNSGGSADQVEWFEEGRRHKLYKATTGDTLSAGASTSTMVFDENPSKYDVLMHVGSGIKVIVTSSQAAVTGGTVDIAHLTSSSDTTVIANNDEFVYLGNMYPQGTDQPSFFQDTTPIRRQNPYMIVKDRFEVNGSQATNIGYVNVGNGDYRWFMHGEQEARKRFMDRRELMLLFGEQLGGAANSAITDLAGSEGYFSTIDSRGIKVTSVDSDPLNSFAEFDLILTELDRQGAPSEYAMYLDRKQSLAIDDMLAAGIATSVTGGLPAQFGAFQNNADMAVQLGFKSFTRGGYSFHKHDWKLLNDPTLVGAVTSGGISGAMVPLSSVADARTGVKAPALEMCYKEANGYSREMEHWVTGGAVLGHSNNGDSGRDAATFHYRSEIALVTRAANQHVILK
tara:strand:- start:4104 stop:5483 length:1380 start_codon:yes stop_codon:yes gene_type:complete